MRCDVLCIGTELLLGQITDTNSAWIGEQLALAGIDSYEHRQVGDNLSRMVEALNDMLTDADALIVCGGLGPTPDDVTREAIAEAMGTVLERRDDLVEWIRGLFGERGRDMRCPEAASRSRTLWAPRPGSSAWWATRSSTPCRACRTRCGS